MAVLDGLDLVHKVVGQLAVLGCRAGARWRTRIDIRLELVVVVVLVVLVGVARWIEHFGVRFDKQAARRVQVPRIRQVVEYQVSDAPMSCFVENRLAIYIAICE